MACNGLKRGSLHLFRHPKWSKIIFEKTNFFWTRWTLLTHVGTHLFGHLVAAHLGGLGVGQGNFQGWKPPKVGGCGWIRCARNHVLSHVAKDIVCFWFGAVGGQGAQILGLLGTFGGHIVELERPRGPFGTEKYSCMCRVANTSLCLASFSRF